MASTPLLDAIGRGINDLEKCLADMKEDDRPSKVVFVVITDGQENASREFRRDQILKMINEKEKQYGWQFVFLSADLDAIDDAMNQGFQPKFSLAFDKNSKGTQNAWGSVSEKISNFRASRSQGVTFSDEDRNKQRSERKRKR
jgi:hypothetical protein